MSYDQVVEEIKAQDVCHSCCGVTRFMENGNGSYIRSLDLEFTSSVSKCSSDAGRWLDADKVVRDVVPVSAMRESNLQRLNLERLVNNFLSVRRD